MALHSCERCRFRAYAERKPGFTDGKNLEVAHQVVSRLEGVPADVGPGGRREEQSVPSTPGCAIVLRNTFSASGAVR